MVIIHSCVFVLDGLQSPGGPSVACGVEKLKQAFSVSISFIILGLLVDLEFDLFASKDTPFLRLFVLVAVFAVPLVFILAL